MKASLHMQPTRFFVGCGYTIALALAMWWLTPYVRLASDAAYAATQIRNAEFPKSLLDPSGITQTLPTPPQRIVSVVLAADEILAEIAPLERIAGVTYLVDDPTASNVLAHYPSEIARTSTNVEALLATNPDLVIVAPFTQSDTVAQLLAAKIPVLRLDNNDSFEQVFLNLRRIGEAIGEDERAQTIELQTRARIDAVRARTQHAKRPRVLVLGANGYTVGSHTLTDEVIHIAGGRNALQEAGFVGDAQISEELAIRLAPDVILLEKDSDELYGDPIAALLQKPAWKNVPAVRQKRVYAHNAPWSAAVSPLRIRDVEEIAAFFHPELFASLPTENTP